MTFGFRSHHDALRGGRFLRVVNYHNTLAADRALLRATLARYAADHASMAPDDLDDFFTTGRWPGERPAFVPVFYEGFRNAFDVAASVCDELGLHAWFAVCTGFVDCPVAEQEVFARSHWLELAGTPGERLAMTWDEVARLAERHTVFAHTATHAGIADTVTDLDIAREITEPKARLEAVTGRECPAFAWLWGSPYGASPRHDAAIRAAGYRFQFSNTMIQRVSQGPRVPSR